MPQHIVRFFVVKREGTHVGIAPVAKRELLPTGKVRTIAGRGLGVSLKNVPTAKAFFESLCRVVDAPELSLPVEGKEEPELKKPHELPLGQLLQIASDGTVLSDG